MSGSSTFDAPLFDASLNQQLPKPGLSLDNLIREQTAQPDVDVLKTLEPVSNA